MYKQLPQQQKFVALFIYKKHLLISKSCIDKEFSAWCKNDCEKSGDEEIGVYLLECQAKSLTLAQAAKMKKLNKCINQNYVSFFAA
jgi:hypothetical protein